MAGPVAIARLLPCALSFACLSINAVPPTHTLRPPCDANCQTASGFVYENHTIGVFSVYATFFLAYL